MVIKMEVLAHKYPQDGQRLNTYLGWSRPYKKLWNNIIGIVIIDYYYRRVGIEFVM